MLPWGSFWRYTNFTDSRFQVNAASVRQLTTPAGPDGTPTIQKLVENSATSEHSINTGPNGLNMWCGDTGIPYTIAFVAKAAERTRVYVTWAHLVGGAPDPNGFASLGFDLSGNQVYGASTTGFTNVSSSITSLGNGFLLCKMTVTNQFVYNAILQAYWVQINLDNGAGVAAPSISYAGNGSSGAYIWWLGMLPTCATQSPWELSFNDDFTSLNTIDITNSKVPGFNWYVNGNWPLSPLVAPWTSRPPGFRCLANALSISSPSVLEMCNPNNNQDGFSTLLYSICPTATNDSYFGHAYKPPFVWDVYMNYDSLVADYSTNWNGMTWLAVWTNGVNILINNAATRFVEIDVIEQSSNITLDNQNHVNSADFAVSGPPQTVYAAAYAKIFNPGVFHRISFMWLPTTLTGQTYGIILYFFDGTFLGASDVAYSASTIPQAQPVGGDTPNIGDMFYGESQNFQIMMSTPDNPTANPGGGWPLFIDYVRVWTP